MTYREYRSWVSYRRKHGSLDAGRRIDRTMGIIASHFASALIKYRSNRKPKPDNFTLYPEQRRAPSGSVDSDLLNFFSKKGAVNE